MHATIISVAQYKQYKYIYGVIGEWWSLSIYNTPQIPRKHFGKHRRHGFAEVLKSVNCYFFLTLTVALIL